LSESKKESESEGFSLGINCFVLGPGLKSELIREEKKKVR